MNDLDRRLVEQSSRIFDRFTKALKAVQPTHVGLGVLAALAPFAVDAIAFEVGHQQALLEQGKDVLDAYLAKQPATTVQTITQAFTGELESKSLARIGNMAVAIATLPLAAGFATHLAQQFINIKSEVNRLKHENDLYQRGINPKLHGENAVLGATRVSQDRLEAIQQERRGRLSEQFERGMAALEGSHSTAHSPKPRGPGL